MSNVDSPGKFVFRVDLEEIEPAPTPGSLYHTYLYNCVITEYESNNHSIRNNTKQTFGLQKVAEHINLRLHLCLLQTTLNAIHTFT